jgi:NAD-dependent oxidoreductase involved in siderophore biosynthesis
VKALAIQLAMSAAVVAVALAGYDRYVIRPAQRIGVVDLAEVYRAKEQEFARLLARGTTEEERQQAQALARRFAERLPTALDELPRDCGCLVVLKSALVGHAGNVIDLTAQLRHKVGA